MATRKRRPEDNKRVGSWNGHFEQDCLWVREATSFLETRRIADAAWSTTTRSDRTRPWTICRRASTPNARRRDREQEREELRREGERPSSDPSLGCTRQKGARHSATFGPEFGGRSRFLERNGVGGTRG